MQDQELLLMISGELAELKEKVALSEKELTLHLIPKYF